MSLADIYGSSNVMSLLHEISSAGDSTSRSNDEQYWKSLSILSEFIKRRDIIELMSKGRDINWY